MKEEIIYGRVGVYTMSSKTVSSKYTEDWIPVKNITNGMIGKINIFKSSKDLPYSAGNGAIISIKPCGFLVNENDNYKMISVLEKTHEKIFEKLTDFLSGISNEKNN